MMQENKIENLNTEREAEVQELNLERKQLIEEIEHLSKQMNFHHNDDDSDRLNIDLGFQMDLGLDDDAVNKFNISHNEEDLVQDKPTES